MSLEQAMELFRRTGVMQEGHFKLTSGRHSDRYMQCARLFQYPAESAKVCTEIVEFFRDKNVDLVAGPAIGGIVMAYEAARILCTYKAGVRNIFAERENGVMTLRRGFQVEPGQRALVVEDVVTTGGSVKEVIELLHAQGVEVVGVGAVVDRSNGAVEFKAADSKIPFHAFAALNVESWEPDACPLCRQGLPIVKPGSRK
ncbi:MAG: orotate phosphoribosyltransferase [Synergistaceae bacterium]|jgi:orotate phosphoribosyltransferase|nr:orotate phosphoribosyltransferase [Synergistaceae bacterium]